MELEYLKIRILTNEACDPTTVERIELLATWFNVRFHFI